MNQPITTPPDDPGDHIARPAPVPPPAGLYIHVPFCRAKCPYCDFYSVTDPRSIPDYIEALLLELQLYRRKVPRADSIYFGGGTPSVLAPGQVARVLDGLRACFPVTPDAETTLEVNPGTVTRSTLTAYHKAGIGRLNIGLQSLDDRTLNFLGRIHTAGKGIDTYRWAREAGFDNVGLDLIYGVPGQTLDRWEKVLARVVGLAPDHLSCYTLTMEPGTEMTARVENGHIQPLGEGTVGDWFVFTSAYLNANGYRQYEISNFARCARGDAADRRSRHNRKYWTFAPYLGFGPAAHSFLDNTRWWNHRSLDTYLADLKAGRRPVADRETLTREQQIIEFVYLGLRQTDGIDTAAFRSRFDEPFSEYAAPQLSQLAREGLVEQPPGRIRLTRQGMRFLESVVGRLLS
ncbi:coproporphyrinogen III oxidase [Desulfosarcina alkanivorans]|uniref:Heme chaperone HemW n=1 Tax=Desulfosarcina alkanivorans TaxID=571177 RepID=A0A5K7YVJ6_9BACT|nr:radical SAM family heme chaperone HemW [Desulfosarcina alkanivorans]BBO72350.1 coproporphyrinogen III oxidase [Desulfosarcina alkanivorans]